MISMIRKMVLRHRSMSARSRFSLCCSLRCSLCCCCCCSALRLCPSRSRSAWLLLLLPASSPPAVGRATTSVEDEDEVEDGEEDKDEAVPEGSPRARQLWTEGEKEPDDPFTMRPTRRSDDSDGDGGGAAAAAADRVPTLSVEDM